MTVRLASRRARRVALDVGRRAEASPAGLKAFTDHTHALTERVYDEMPPSALSWNYATAGVELARLVIEGRLRPGMTVADVGCGPGTEAVFLATRGMDVVGVDRVPSALRMARGLARHYGVRVRCW